MALTPEGGQRKWENNWEQWKLDCAKKHDNKFTYPSMERVKDENGRWKVEIICPEHGSFFQDPAKHKFGQGCSVCSGNSNTETDLEFAEKHFPEIDWTGEIRDRNNKKRLVGICKHHGEFNKINSQLRGIVKSGKGHACPRCAKMKIHQAPLEVVKLDVKPCLHTIDRDFKELREFFKGLGFKVLDIAEDDSLGDLLGSYSFEVECKGSSVYVEYLVAYFNSDEVKLNRLHLDEKVTKIREKGLTYLAIFEGDWKTRRSQIEREILRMFFGNDRRGHKSEVKVIPWLEAMEFYENNHLKGSPTRSSLNYALQDFDGEVIACMSFSKPRFDKVNDVEIIRFYSVNHLVGEFHTLLNEFIKDNPNTNNLIAYTDRLWLDGNMYDFVGFEYADKTQPNYVWYKDDESISRYDSQRHKLETLFGKEFPETMSEAQIMRSEGYWRVFDAGNSKWVLTLR